MGVVVMGQRLEEDMIFVFVTIVIQVVVVVLTLEILTGRANNIMF